MKNILVVYYSQSGNLCDIVRNFLSSWEKDFHVDYLEIKPVMPFPYPWKNFSTFFSVFPECALETPCELEKIDIPEKKYDLVIFGVQSWFLFPSIPISSFMQNLQFERLMQNQKIIIVVQSRNSWRNCLKMVEEKIKTVGGNIISEYIFTDPSKNLIGAISLFFWLFKGKKKIKFLPEAGVSVDDIKNANVYGEMALERFANDVNSHKTIIPENYSKFTSEGYETYIINKYKKWAFYITENNNRYRKWRITLFRMYILFGIVFIAPIVSIKNRIK